MSFDPFDPLIHSLSLPANSLALFLVQKLRERLIPLLKPGQGVVLDNATFHKGGRIEQMILDAGCEVCYLPPYSPDLNLIERCWSWLKSRIRKKLGQADCLRDAMEDVLRAAS